MEFHLKIDLADRTVAQIDRLIVALELMTRNGGYFGPGGPPKPLNELNQAPAAPAALPAQAAPSLDDLFGEQPAPPAPAPKVVSVDDLKNAVLASKFSREVLAALLKHKYGGAANIRAVPQAQWTNLLEDLSKPESAVKVEIGVA